ncbi:cytochrome P450 [Calycina marina]|uniref:Cytochrome P450 n=1 Tax=Calycina marina TaxID=1763456 RepID=A0A9P8CF64_9HELO|nr:cytochrome P450 [Calycina marina]
MDLQNSASRLHLLLFFPVAGVLWIVAYVVYQQWCHPLAKYPGPFLAKFTNLYAAHHAWKGDLHLDMWRMHLKYGDKVRYAPNRLLFNTSAALKDIYSNNKNVKKSEVYNAMVHRAPNTLTQRDKKLHARNRRLISQGFSESSMRVYEKPMAAQIDIFCRCLMENEEEPINGISYPLEGGWSPPRDMAKWCERLAFDLMFDIVFNDEYEMVGKPNYRRVLDAISTSAVRVGVLVQAPELKESRRLNKWLFPKQIAARTEFISFVNKMLQSKGSKSEAEANPDRRNVFTILTNAKDPETGESLRASEIGAESTTLIIAGSDTTSTALSAFFFYISRNSHVYDKVAKEVREHFTNAEEIHNRPKVNQCLYLRACIDEAMRMSPSVGSALYREVENGGAFIDGDHIPAGYDVGTGIYSIHHNPEYFPYPFKYHPERWIVGPDASTKDSVERAQSAYTTFSLGPRGCIGKGLAMMEMMSVLATVLYKFDFKIPEGQLGRVGEGNIAAEFGRHRDDELQLKDQVTAAKFGPVLQFRPRIIES